MTTIAQKGVFSIAPQASKIGEDGTFDMSSLTWYRYKAQEVNYGPVEESNLLPPEVGGIAVPTGAYKAGLSKAGGAT